MKKIKISYLELVLLVGISSIMLSIITGSLVYKKFVNNTGKVNNTNNKYVNEFIGIYNKILDEYYEDLDEDKLVKSAINGMLDIAGDNYTIYMDENATDALNEKLDGTYEGIGIRIGKNDDNDLVIYEVFDESPANKAGIQVNDIILAIDDIDVTTISTDEVTKIIRDSKNNKFKIKIKRNGNIKEFVIEKKTLIVPALTSKLKEVNGKKIGYIYIETFSNTIDTQFETTLLTMEKEGIDSLIIDVRYNTGGYLSSCTNIIKLFLEKNKLMYTIKSRTTSEDFKDDTDTKRSIPVVVLVNSTSASASEILAGALKYSYDAIIIGTKTYGKGKVQTTDKLTDGTMIKYTTAKWYMPNGDCVDGVGIEPDIKINISEEFIKNPTEENDNQLNEAIKILSN